MELCGRGFPCHVQVLGADVNPARLAARQRDRTGGPHRVTDDLRSGEKMRRGLCADGCPPPIVLAASALPAPSLFREPGSTHTNAAQVDHHTGEPKSRLRIVGSRSIRPRDMLLERRMLLFAVFGEIRLQCLDRSSGTAQVC
jgi:hypothetical protein